jgi:hypothetical protein
MIEVLIWLAIAWVGGIAAILGSLMFLGSLLLWLIPTPTVGKQSLLLAIALGLMLAGLTLLRLFPFPVAVDRLS